MIYIITDMSFPYGMASTKRINAYAEGLASNNEETQIIIAKRTEYFKGKVQNTKAFGYISDKASYKYIAGTTSRSKNFFARRIFDLFDYIHLFFFLLCNLDKTTASICYSHTIVLQLIVAISSKLKKSIVIRELCEYPGRTSTIVTPRKKIETFLNFHITFKLFDGFIAISESLKDVAEKYKSKDAKIIKVPILISESSFKNTNMSLEINKPYIFHSGTLSESKDGFCGLIQSFALACIKQKDLHFYSTGIIEKCEKKEEIRKIILDNALQDRIHFLGFITDEELSFYQKNASLFIINKLDTFQNKYCFSTKLGEYLATGNPVVTTDIGESSFYLRNMVNSIIVPHNNVDSLAESIIFVLENKQISQQIGKKGGVLTRTVFNSVYQGSRLIEFINSFHNI